MIRMKEIIKEEFPEIITYGCSAHYLNLVEKEVSTKTILKHIVEVNKYFRNHHRPHVSNSMQQILVLLLYKMFKILTIFTYYSCTALLKF